MAILPWLALLFEYLPEEIWQPVVTGESFANWSEDKACDYQLRSASAEDILLHWQQSLPKFTTAKQLVHSLSSQEEYLLSLFCPAHPQSLCPYLILILVTFAVDYISQGKRGGKQIEL